MVMAALVAVLMVAEDDAVHDLAILTLVLTLFRQGYPRDDTVGRERGQPPEKQVR